MQFNRDRSDVRWYDLVFVGLCIAIALVASSRAEAQQSCPPSGPVPTNAALLCWTNATQDVDGNPLPATGPGALTQTRAQRAVVAASATCSFSTIAETLNVTPDVTMLFFQNLTAGKHCYRARHIALDAAGAELLSDWTPYVSKVVAPAAVKPRPLTITIH